MVIPHPKVDFHALLTRAPLLPKDPFDLHVLGLPPAFVLSQDQTLRFKLDLPITEVISTQFDDPNKHLLTRKFPEATG